MKLATRRSIAARLTTRIGMRRGAGAGVEGLVAGLFIDAPKMGAPPAEPGGALARRRPRAGMAFAEVRATIGAWPPRWIDRGVGAGPER